MFVSPDFLLVGRELLPTPPVDLGYGGTSYQDPTH